MSRRRVRAPRYPLRSGRSRTVWRQWRRRFRRRKRKDRDWVAITATSLPGITALAALIFTALQVQATQGQLLTTQQQLRITERGQITDRYNAAIGNLGASSVDIRLGGIYALQRLMRDSPPDQSAIIAVLCAFVCNQPASDQSFAGSAATLPTDIQAALTVIGTRNVRHDHGTTLIDLNHALLADAQLASLHLVGADFPGAKLVDANLNHSHLKGADFSGADLDGANLIFADLADADFTDANLSMTHLTDTDLVRANLMNANLTGANLAGADLRKANLIGANFSYANLAGASFYLATLTDANLTGANLTDAYWPQKAVVPAGWTRDPSTGRLAPARP